MNGERDITYLQWALHEWVVVKIYTSFTIGGEKQVARKGQVIYTLLP